MEAARKAAEIEAMRWDGAADPEGTANAITDAFLAKLSETHAIVPKEPTEARKAAGAALGDALRAAADHVYWYDGADAEVFCGGEPEIDEFQNGVKLADRFDLQAIADAVIKAYEAALTNPDP